LRARGLERLDDLVPFVGNLRGRHRGVARDLRLQCGVVRLEIRERSLEGTLGVLAQRAQLVLLVERLSVQQIAHALVQVGRLRGVRHLGDFFLELLARLLHLVSRLRERLHDDATE
jgi:hypothetical protein